MEKDLEMKLNNIYKEKIKIKFLRYGIYEAFFKINGQAISVIFTLNFHYNFEANLNNVIAKIDKEIVNLFKI